MEKEERNMKLNQLNNAIGLRSSEDQVLWSIFGAFWGSNAILLVALFTTGKLPQPPVGIVVSLVGFALSIVWKRIQDRAIGHLKKFEELIKKLELNLEIERTFAISGEINTEDYYKFVGKKFWNARRLMKTCCSIGAVLWFIAFAYFIREAFCS